MKKGQLVPRDFDVLRFLARFGVATVEMVHAELYQDQQLRNAYRRLEVLASHKLVKYQKIFYRKPGVWWASKAGVELSGVDLAPYKLNKVLLEHTLELVNLYQAIVASKEGFLRYRTEREVRRDTKEKPIPDALVAFEPNLWTALELELVNKRNDRYSEKLRDYANTLDLEGVRFYFRSGDGARRAARIAAKVSAETSAPEGYFRFYEYRPEGFFSDVPGPPSDKERIRYLGPLPHLG